MRHARPPLDARAEARHPRFPYRAWVVVEQPRHEPMRYRFVPERQEFVRTEERSLIFARGFGGAYGWIGGTGTPPGRHYDALVVTERDVAPGEVVEVVVSGVFVRGDGDHKFVTIDMVARPAERPEWAQLPPDVGAELRALYPRVGPGEGWHGAVEARRRLRDEPPTSA